MTAQKRMKTATNEANGREEEETTNNIIKKNNADVSVWIGACMRATQSINGHAKFRRFVCNVLEFAIGIIRTQPNTITINVYSFVCISFFRQRSQFLWYISLANQTIADGYHIKSHRICHHAVDWLNYVISNISKMQTTRRSVIKQSQQMHCNWHGVGQQQISNRMTTRPTKPTLHKITATTNESRCVFESNQRIIATTANMAIWRQRGQFVESDRQSIEPKRVVDGYKPPSHCRTIHDCRNEN